MCSHATHDDALRCSCTGYGMGDPPCRCGYGKSQHVDGTGPCVIAAARCHEFVLHFAETFPVTVDLINMATEAIIKQVGPVPVPADMARTAATAALLAGRAHALQRDAELDRVRRMNGTLRDQIAALTAELEKDRI